MNDQPKKPQRPPTDLNDTIVSVKRRLSVLLMEKEMAENGSSAASLHSLPKVADKGNGVNSDSA